MKTSISHSNSVMNMPSVLTVSHFLFPTATLLQQVIYYLNPKKVL